MICLNVHFLWAGMEFRDFTLTYVVGGCSICGRHALFAARNVYKHTMNRNWWKSITRSFCFCWWKSIMHGGIACSMNSKPTLRKHHHKKTYLVQVIPWHVIPHKKKNNIISTWILRLGLKFEALNNPPKTDQTWGLSNLTPLDRRV